NFVWYTRNSGARGGLGVACVPDEIAEAVGDVGLVERSGPLGPVGVAADDDIRPGRGQRPGQVTLGRAGAAFALDAPMQVDDDDVGLGVGHGDRLEQPVRVAGDG